MKILFVTSEAFPFAKTGGLADVAHALPKALKDAGHDIRVVLPRYWGIDQQKFGLQKVLSPMGVAMGSGTVWTEVWEGKADGIPFYFIEYEKFFGRAGLYDDGKDAYSDNGARFGFFSRAAIQLCRDLNFKPDIFHANDWQTALVPYYLKVQEWQNPFFKKTASVFTIHNMAYQGKFPIFDSFYLGMDAAQLTESRFEDHGNINFMKGAFFYADAITTVSPGYAKEILSEPGGNGLSQYLNRREADLTGILNGADGDHWDPETDELIPANYSLNDLSGKAVCKRELQKQFLLEPNSKVPVVGLVARFCEQKGLHLLMPVVREIVDTMLIQLVFLGNGEKWLEDFFGGLPAEFPGKIGAWIGYDSRKAHLIEAGSDFFLMPSLYEPCGLNQIYSMQYGTLPIVRATGGLKDTVEQYDEATGEGTGFLFDSPDPQAIRNTIGWAVSTYFDRPQHLQTMQSRAMKKKFCWKEAAAKYEEVYRKALARRAFWM